MAKIVPSTNVIIATVAGMLTAIIEHVCKSNMIDIPDDVNAGLPATVTCIVAYLYDCIFESKQPPDASK